MTTLLKLSLFCWMCLGTAMPNSSINNTDDCAMTLQSEVDFSFERKMVNSAAFPTEKMSAIADFNGNFTPGMLEICINATGACQWKFQSKEGTPQNNLSITIPGFEDIIKHLQLGNSSLSDFLKIVESKGGQLTDLGNQTSSIRMNYPALGRTVITLIDRAQGKILGSSVYKNDRELEAKLICQYPTNAQNRQPNTISILLFEHQVGEAAGWVTEIIAKYKK